MVLRLGLRILPTFANLGQGLLEGSLEVGFYLDLGYLAVDPVEAGWHVLNEGGDDVLDSLVVAIHAIEGAL